MNSNTNSQGEFPSASELCVVWPLYKEYVVANTAKIINDLYNFITSNDTIDTFCPWCGDQTVIFGGKHELDVSIHNFTIKNRFFNKKFICSRKHHHDFVFYFRLHKRMLSKVGQSPSMADIEKGYIKKYRQVIDQKHYKELSRALGLASHGVGIGSFVYLRRIFEKLVEEARLKAAQKADWDDDAYQRSRMDEKIDLLRSYLPDFLVSERKIYSILSAGIHELNEDMCLQYFPVIKTGIELILDQTLAMNEQEKKMNSAKKEIAEIHKELKSDTSNKNN